MLGKDEVFGVLCLTGWEQKGKRHDGPRTTIAESTDFDFAMDAEMARALNPRVYVSRMLEGQTPFAPFEPLAYSLETGSLA